MGKVHFRFHPSHYGGFKISGNDKPAEEMSGDYWSDDDYRALETEVTNLRMAVGLATTCAPKLVMNPDDPIGMMQEVYNEFRALEAENEQLKTLLKDAVHAVAEDDDEVVALEAKLAALVEAGEVLLKKLKLVHDSAEYEAVWHISQSHVGPYKGPTYNEEMDTLKAAISAAGGKP